MSTYNRVSQAVPSPSLPSEKAFDWLDGAPTPETETLDRARRWVELATLPAAVAETVCPVARATSRTPREVPSVEEIQERVPNWSDTVFPSDPPSLGLRKSARTESDAMVFFAMASEVPNRTVLGQTRDPSANFEPLPS